MLIVSVDEKITEDSIVVQLKNDLDLYSGLERIEKELSILQKPTA